ncbi:MAG: nucleoside 2-deoxyribosyltransferase [Clostridia bacterium]|nr:nucleoside 2-deoxyribosyltransferase [Clostridia bacterium]
MKIYISGSIYGGTQKIETYKILIKELEKYGQVMNKQVADENTIANEAYQKDDDIFCDLEKKLYDADLIFAEVSIPSLGVGYELGFADKIGKKIIAIYDCNYIEKVSTMIRGNKRIKLIPYKDIREITDNLKEIIGL